MNGRITYRFADFTMELDLTDEIAGMVKDDGSPNWQAISGTFRDGCYTLFRSGQGAAAAVKEWGVENGVQRMAGQDAKAAQTPQQTDVIIVDRVAHEFSDGAHKFKVFGGRWGKFGVFAYSDSCKDDAGLFDCELGEHKVDGVTAVIAMSNGKPTKVLEYKFTADASAHS